MPLYRITLSTRCKEVYDVNAATQDEALDQIENGVGDIDPIIGRVIGSSVERIVKLDA